MIEISNFLYNLARGLASHLLSDPETRRNLFPPLPPLNNVFFISFFFLVAFLFIVQYFVRQFSHCAINSFCPNCCVVLVTWVIRMNVSEENPVLNTIAGMGNTTFNEPNPEGQNTPHDNEAVNNDVTMTNMGNTTLSREDDINDDV